MTLREGFALVGAVGSRAASALSRSGWLLVVPSKAALLRRSMLQKTVDRERVRAESRIWVLVGFFLVAYVTVGGRMAVLASSEPEEVQPQISIAAPILSSRADITDREGRILATNLATHALYAQPKEIISPANAASQLAAIFPDLDEERLLRDFTGDRRFLWIRRQISPEQAQAVFDIGEPGLLFGPREMRLYPNGPIAAHVLGGAAYGREGVDSAEIIGVAGAERFFDARLRDPVRQHEPLQLSLDLSVQATLEDVLAGGMSMMNAKGATGIIMDVDTGELVAMASLPDFDPNQRPPVAITGDAGDSPLFNRAIQGLYELGSVFKIFTIAHGMELGLINPQTTINTQSPLTWGRFRISDFRNYGAQNTTTDVIVKSSNVGTVNIALMIGAERQQRFLRDLGLLNPTTIELAEAPTARPLLPAQWSEISLMTISYGHGVSTSPLHLAAAYATIANGGLRVTPTLLRQDNYLPGPRVLSEEASYEAVQMLRQVVVRGTATLAEVEGYEVAGKTGTADKPRPTGGYYDDKVIATFAGVFPASDPQYAVVVSLDEPEETSGVEPRRTAGWTAVPVAAELIRRAGPLLGVRPKEELPIGTAVPVPEN